MAEHGRCQTEVRWVPAATVVASEETALDRETQRKTQPRGGTAQTRGRPTCVRATTMGSLGRQAHAHPRLPRYRGRRSGASRGDDRGKEAGELRCYEIQLPKCQSLTRVWRNALERASNQSLELPHTNKQTCKRLFTLAYSAGGTSRSRHHHYQVRAPHVGGTSTHQRLLCELIAEAPVAQPATGSRCPASGTLW